MEARDYVQAIRGRGLTQAQISAKTGIPQPTISKIERGDVADVMSKNYRALQCLHDALHKEAAATPQPTTEPAAASMALLLQSGLEKAEQALADEPTDRVARLIKRNRTQALAEIAPSPDLKQAA